MSQEMELEQLRALLNTAHERSTCPPADRLARAAAGEADAGERRQLADHFAGCALCSEEYRTAVALGPWAHAASDDPAFGGSHTRPTVAWRPQAFAYAAAALLVVGVVVVLAAWGLTLRGENARLTAALANRTDDGGSRVEARNGVETKRIAELHGRLAEAMAPAVNVPIVDLLPRDAVRGVSSAAVPRVPAGAKSVTFVITTATDPADREHELEIVDATGAVRWRGAGLRPNVERTFTVTVPGALLPAGTCHVRLYERRDARARLVADYGIDVES